MKCLFNGFFLLHGYIDWKEKQKKILCSFQGKKSKDPNDTKNNFIFSLKLSKKYHFNFFFFAVGSKRESIFWWKLFMHKDKRVRNKKFPTINNAVFLRIRNIFFQFIEIFNISWDIYLHDPLTLFYNLFLLFIASL